MWAPGAGQLEAAECLEWVGNVQVHVQDVVVDGKDRMERAVAALDDMWTRA